MQDLSAVNALSLVEEVEQDVPGPDPQGAHAQGDEIVLCQQLLILSHSIVDRLKGGGGHSYRHLLQRLIQSPEKRRQHGQQHELLQGDLAVRPVKAGLEPVPRDEDSAEDGPPLPVSRVPEFLDQI